MCPEYIVTENGDTICCHRNREHDGPCRCTVEAFGERFTVEWLLEGGTE